MTNKKMTDEEFRDAMLSSLSELHQEVNRFQDDLDVLRVALILMASKNGIDSEQLFIHARQLQTLNVLEKLEKKGE